MHDDPSHMVGANKNRYRLHLARWPVQNCWVLLRDGDHASGKKMLTKRGRFGRHTSLTGSTPNVAFAHARCKDILCIMFVLQANSADFHNFEKQAAMLLGNNKLPCVQAIRTLQI